MYDEERWPTAGLATASAELSAGVGRSPFAQQPPATPPSKSSNASAGGAIGRRHIMNLSRGMFGKRPLARHGRAAALGVGLTAHLVAAAACASQGALLTRRPARQAVLRRPSVRVAFVTRCANSAVQSA